MFTIEQSFVVRKDTLFKFNQKMKQKSSSSILKFGTQYLSSLTFIECDHFNPRHEFSKQSFEYF